MKLSSAPFPRKGGNRKHLCPHSHECCLSIPQKGHRLLFPRKKKPKQSGVARHHRWPQRHRHRHRHLRPFPCPSPEPPLPFSLIESLTLFVSIVTSREWSESVGWLWRPVLPRLSAPRRRGPPLPSHPCKVWRFNPVLS